VIRVRLSDLASGPTTHSRRLINSSAMALFLQNQAASLFLIINSTLNVNMTPARPAVAFKNEVRPRLRLTRARLH
jgi:hypothetical protein